MHILDRCLWRDPVPEIEDQRSLAKTFENGVHAFIQRIAACHHAQRVEIALYRTFFLKGGSKGKRNGPVETESIDASFFAIACIKHSCPLREADDARLGVNRPHLLD